MKKLYSSLIKVSDTIFIAEKWLLVLAAIVTVMVNFVNVCLRYFAKSGLSYCETLSICLFMFMVVIGGNIAVKTDGEIKIDIFKFKSASKDAAFRMIPDVVTIVTLVLALAGIATTISSVIANPQRVTPLPIYTYHIYIVMFIGFVMMLLDRIIVFLRHILVAGGETVEEEARTL